MATQQDDMTEKVYLLREIALNETIRQLKNENSQLKLKLIGKDKQILQLQNYSQDYQQIFLKQREELLRLTLHLQEYTKERESNPKSQYGDKSHIIDEEVNDILGNKRYRDLQNTPNKRKQMENSPTAASPNISYTSSPNFPRLYQEKQQIFKSVKKHFMNEREKNISEMYSEDFFDIVKKKREGYLKLKQGMQERFQNMRESSIIKRQIKTEVEQQDNNILEQIDQRLKYKKSYETSKRNSNSFLSSQQTPQQSSIKYMTPQKYQKIPSSVIKQNNSFNTQCKSPQSNQCKSPENNQESKSNDIDINRMELSSSTLVIPKNRLQAISQENIAKKLQDIQNSQNFAS